MAGETIYGSVRKIANAAAVAAAVAASGDVAAGETTFLSVFP